MRDNLKERIYDILVNGNAEIAARYQSYAQGLSGSGRLRAWLYLIALNVKYRIFGKKGNPQTPTENKKLCLEKSESALSLRESPQDLAKKLSQYDVVCFDVFDTLIFRPFAAPTDLFYLVGDALDYLNFTQIRRDMERRAREKKKHSTGTTEVTFAEIWQEMEEHTGIPSQMGANAEWSLEQKYCFANPYMQEVTRELEKLGVKTAVVSDMYLGKERIQALLQQCGFGVFDHYFVSCDYGKSKSDGSLYEVVKQTYGETLRYVQVGDNRYSDIIQAQKYGFSTVYYPNVNIAGKPYRAEDLSKITGSIYRGLVNAYLHNGLREYSQEYEFGFIYGGILCMGYCQWIHEYVKNHGIDKILFLARDGDILQQVYGYLYPAEKETCSYVYWSRLAAVKMTAGYYKYDYFRRFLHHKVNQGYSLQEVFRSMELEDMLEEFLRSPEAKGNCQKKSLLSAEIAQHVQRFLEQHWQAVQQHYQPQIQAGGAYYGKVLAGAKKAVAVDSGWAGSGAVSLEYLVNQVWHLDCEIIGLLAGTNSRFSQEPDTSEAMLYTGKLVSYAFSQQHNRDIWKAHNPNQGDNLVVELLFSSPEKSFRGFGENGELVFSQTEEKANVREIQQGILDYVKWHNEHMGNAFPICGRDAIAPLRIVAENREWFRRVSKIDTVQMNLE